MPVDEKEEYASEEESVFEVIGIGESRLYDPGIFVGSCQEP